MIDGGAAAERDFVGVYQQKLYVFYSSLNLEPEDQTLMYEVGDCSLGKRDFDEVKNLHSCIKKENVGGEVPFKSSQSQGFHCSKKNSCTIS